MNRKIRVTALVLLAALATATAKAAPDARTVLRAIEDNHRGGAGRATITLTVSRPDRRTEYVLVVWSDGEERGLVQVKSPARDAGQAFLKVGDNLWVYTPRLKRTLRLPPSGRSESFLGSDISYSDLSGRDIEQDYTARVASADAKNVVLELIPRPSAPTPYGKLTVTADASTFAPQEWLFYDQRGQAVKRVAFSQHTKIGDRLFPTRTIVEDLLRSGYRTTAVYSDYRFGVKAPEACFTLQALEQGCE